jgi:hypothetical protein
MTRTPVGSVGGCSSWAPEGQDLLAQDVGVSRVVREFSEHLHEQRPDRAFPATSNHRIELQFGHHAT